MYFYNFMNSASLRKTLRVLHHKQFKRFILTRFSVIFSLFLQTTVLSYLMYSITSDPLSLGLMGLAEVIPAFGLAFFAGYWVDQNEKRRIYSACVSLYLVNALTAALIVYLYFNGYIKGNYTAWGIYTLQFLSGCIRAFLAPASFSLLPLLVPKESIAEAVTWSSTSWLLASVLGPLAGGLLMGSIGHVAAMGISVVGMVIAMYALLGVSSQPLHKQHNVPIWEGLAQGFRFVFRSQIILAVLSLDLFAVLFGGAEALLPVFSKEIFNVDETGFGWLRSAHGIGSILLLFILAYLPLKNNVGYKLLACVAGFGICIIAFALSPNAYIAFFCLLLAGLFDGVSVVIRQSILQINTPDELKGRVSSINMLFISSSNELGAFESGLAARYLGTIPSVVFGGIMTLLVVVVTYFKAPGLKHVQLNR
jgi:MFS family permease